MKPPRSKAPLPIPKQPGAARNPALKQLAPSKGDQKKAVAAKMGRIVQRYQGK
ncbi:hypothetical protein [Georgfuchsia toluolica]|uniref:hypothetical protein n=1 Tax=Georgfuchsia toluolica TaxID=424218 RepID=UPI001C734901|nr:hypothetical protein [Georgfuchsia toluolica]